MARVALPCCAVIGVFLAFAIVLAWFPNSAGVWHLPLQQIDAPAHYLFIRKILRFGPSAALHLWDNGTYYPPLFHLIAAGLIALGRVFGINVSIYAAFNIVWLATSGLVWPAGMSLLSTYWTRRVDGSNAGGSPASGAKGLVSVLRPFSCCMAILVPVLSVSSASHPFAMLAEGPLISYGLATTLLPFWFYATLRCFDAVGERRHILKWVLLTIALGALCIFAHPRIAFTWLLLMAPFIILRLPWKLIVGTVLAVVACAAVFFVYMTHRYISNRYLDPSSWFHTFAPSRSVSGALGVLFSDNIPGFAGGLMAVVVVLALVVAALSVVGPGSLSKVISSLRPSGRPVRGAGRPAGRPASPYPNLRKDAIALILDFALVGLVYVCSASLTGWFPNIVAAAWYRAETRPRTMLPFAIVPLLAFAACALAGMHGNGVSAQPGTTGTSAPASHAGAALAEDASQAAAAKGVDGSASESCTSASGSNTSLSAAERTSGQRSEISNIGGIAPASPLLKAVAILVLAVLALVCQFGNTTRSDLGNAVAYNMQLDGKPADEQLTAAKYEVLRQTVKVTGTDALIVSDPLNGSMYATTLFGANTLYPVYNQMHEHNGAIFGKVEDSFAAGDGGALLDTVCPVTATSGGGRSNTYAGDRHSAGPVYFLAMGPQAPSLQIFTFRQQYDTFHDQKLIDSYVQNGTMHKVKDFSGMGTYAKGWALYRFGCGQ